MQATLVKTNEMYHEIINAGDDETRMALYLAHFVKPWERMMTMFAQGYGNGATDALARARAWHWLLPDDLQTIPNTLAALESAGARLGSANQCPVLGYTCTVKGRSAWLISSVSHSTLSCGS